MLLLGWHSFRCAFSKAVARVEAGATSPGNTAQCSMTTTSFPERMMMTSLPSTSQRRHGLVDVSLHRDVIISLRGLKFAGESPANFKSLSHCPVRRRCSTRLAAAAVWALADTTSRE
jgi:hypothetical protein